MNLRLLIFVALALGLAACDSFLGSKSDETTDEIFEEGRIPPTLVSEAEYVPLFPFLTLGGDGAPLDAPQDVYVGYDELIYVVDARGLHILDLAGRPAAFLALDGAVSTGAWLTSPTVIVKVSASLSTGVPLSLTVTVAPG